MQSEIYLNRRNRDSYRHLPHIRGARGPQFVTFRLADSLPRHVLAKVLWNQPDGLAYLEDCLDKGYGSCWLRRPDIATTVQSALQHFHDDRYRLHAWVIMPNHVHILLTPQDGWELERIIKSLKSFSGRMANRVLNREGAFWQEDYFDRAIRNVEHHSQVVEYIHWNPVKAGLCMGPTDWAYSSVSGCDIDWIL